MTNRHTREQTLARLRAEIERGRPLVMTGAGNGIAAKFIERGGVDLLGVYNTSWLRMHGWGSLGGMLPIGDANEIVYEVGRRHVLPQVREVPVIAGVNGVDPLRDMRLFLEDCARIGYAGVHNFPTVGWFDGEFRATLEGTGLGFEHELRMLRLARELDLLTIGYAFDERDTRALMEEAAPDVFVFHAGITRGGATGYAGGASMQETAERSQRHFAIAREIKPDVILLGHGAALAEPEDARAMVDGTDAQGVQLGSAIERLAIEQPLERRAGAFKQAMLRDGAAGAAGAS